MGDDTKELLKTHQAAILRELDRLHVNVSESFDDLKHDVSGIRSRLDIHNAEDNKRFEDIGNNLSVLKWAYGVGLCVLAAIFALLKSGVLP